MQHKPKPVHRPRYGIISQPNVPYAEPLTPGLRRHPPANAIGFTAKLAYEPDDERD